MSGFERPPSLPEVIYTPESRLRHPVTLMRSMLRDLVVSRELAWRLFVRNIKAQYRQTALGYLWAFIPPIFTTLTFVFLRSQGVLQIEDTGHPYLSFLIVGTVLWQGFADAVRAPLSIVVNSRTMLAKANFPREALVVAAFGEVLLNTTIRFVPVVIVLLWGGVKIGMGSVIVPACVLALLVLGLVTGVLITPIGVLYKDVENGLNLFLTLWFFLTPVVYPAPTSYPASLLVKLNPVSPLLETSRELILGGSVQHGMSSVVVVVLILVVGLAAWVVFRLAMDHVVERLDA